MKNTNEKAVAIKRLPDLPGQMLLWGEPSNNCADECSNASDGNPNGSDRSPCAIPRLLKAGDILA